MVCAQLRTCLQRNNKWTNNYQPWTILHHRGNMDMQSISNPYGAATYSCMYSSKIEAPDQMMLSKKNLNMLAKESELGIHTLTRKKLFICAQAVFSSREVSMQELSWYLLGFKFV